MCLARKPVHLADREDNCVGDVEEDQGNNNLLDAEIVKEEAEHVSYVAQRLLYTPKQKEPSQQHRIFHSLCLVQQKVCNLIIDSGSCEITDSKALVKHLQLPTEPYPSPYEIGWIKQGPSIKVTEICSVPISIVKSYKDDVVCDVVDMDACHILLGRPWQHDVDATHKGRKNVYIFWWKEKKIAIPPNEFKGDQPKTAKVKGKSFLSITSSYVEFIADVKEASESYVLIVKGEESPMVEVPTAIQPLLEEFKEFIPKDLPKGLQPMRDIQHHIDFVLGASLPNLPHYQMNPKESEILKEKVE